nr:MAG TPA: hypothetical protein [Caudoviricetes sp.]
MTRANKRKVLFYIDEQKLVGKMCKFSQNSLEKCVKSF